MKSAELPSAAWPGMIYQLNQHNNYYIAIES